jgi:hypothetical protein
LETLHTWIRWILWGLQLLDFIACVLCYLASPESLILIDSEQWQRLHVSVVIITNPLFWPFLEPSFPTVSLDGVLASG